nr:hypothetical protein [Caldilineaceae bacterium]
VEVINIPSESKLGAVTVDVGYDPAQLALLACKPPPDNRFDSVVCNINEPGLAHLSALSAAGIAGDATIALFDLQSAGEASTVSTLALTVTTFVDVNANPLAVSRQDGAVVFRCSPGDVDCDHAITLTDALFIVQYERQQRPASETIPPPPGFLYLMACDLNGDQSCTSEDARLIVECAVGQQNELCSEGD